ncbi:hypothetical protein [Acinetobacter nectaris]|uniref:hypothetical protein n=1 Tax=Acinetobacter nectaris TaxID=1219382 RepID=UPI001F422A7D|nr:hypothetical protein [Acinetobacter nectaris]MCF9047376.1 hypothetical protein [Acinetobacter nectaris]
MAVSDSQKKTWLNEINQREKKIIDIKAKSQKDVAYEEKKIIDLKQKINNG